MRRAVIGLCTALFFGCSGEESAGDGAGEPRPDGGDTTPEGGTDAGAPDYARCRPATSSAPPACGSGELTFSGLITAGGAHAGLASKALRIERQFHALHTTGHGVNADLRVALDRTAERALVEDFVKNSNDWDFEAATGRSVTSVIDGFQKVAGAYAGVGVAADAFRYATLRDGGADCAEVDRARQHLFADLDALHLAVAITGVEGVIARGFARVDLPGAGEVAVVPLFDDAGNPLPPDKDNGTWRADNSGGQYPDYIWEDSCSRDMLAGWAHGYAAAWEVIRLDPTFPRELKARLQADAAAIARSLSVVRESGYDLEILDADGRRTFHGNLNENSIDRVYFPGAENGFYAILSLGIVGALAYVAEDPEVDAWLQRTLIEERQLHVVARDKMKFVDMGVGSNFSNYNMAFTGGWLGVRYLCDDEARRVTREAVDVALYAIPGHERQPLEQKQSFFDLTYIAARGGMNAWKPEPEAPIDDAALGRALETLGEYWEPPFWNVPRVNCDDQEILALQCSGIDGTAIVLIEQAGRGDTLVAREPVPMRIRPASNYYWRSNPYAVNGDSDGTGLIGGVDFRMAYWSARWLRR